MGLTDLFSALDIQRYDLDALTSLIDPRQTGRWKHYADEDWFRDQEALCESTIQEFLGEDRRQTKPAAL